MRTVPRISSKLSVDLLSQRILYVLILLQDILTSSVTIIYVGRRRCLENQLLNMSCMESGKNIHQEKTTGCQSTSVSHNKRRALGPTGAYRIEYRRGQPVHTRALVSVTLLFTIIVPLTTWRLLYSE